MVLQRKWRPSIACVNVQLDPHYAACKHTTAPINHTRPSPCKHSPDVAAPVQGSKHPITAYCSIYRPRKNERLSWPGLLTCSGRFTHISGHPSAAGRAQDRESSPAKDRRSTTVPRHQLTRHFLSLRLHHTSTEPTVPTVVNCRLSVRACVRVITDLHNQTVCNDARRRQDSLHVLPVFVTQPAQQLHHNLPHWTHMTRALRTPTAACTDSAGPDRLETVDSTLTMTACSPVRAVEGCVCDPAGRSCRLATALMDMSPAAPRTVS